MLVELGLFMNAITSKVAATYAAICRKAHVLGSAHGKNASLFVMLLGGVALLTLGLADVSFAQLGAPTDDKIGETANTILSVLIEGTFGALIMIVAGLVAIVAAAMGAYRAAMACLVVAVGAFILRTFVEIFFGDIIN